MKNVEKYKEKLLRIGAPKIGGHQMYALTHSVGHKLFEIAVH